MIKTNLAKESNAFAQDPEWRDRKGDQGQQQGALSIHLSLGFFIQRHS